MKQISLFIISVLLSVSLFAQSDNSKEKKEAEKKPYLNLWVLIQNDFIYDFKQMDPDWIGGFRPSKIPVYPTDPGWGTNGGLYYSMRPSTFKFEGVIPVNHKWSELKLRFEFDLFGMGAYAGETAIRFRQAYGDWGPWRIGKDWSTFIDLEAFPNIYDWWGPSGMALLPSATLRFTQDLSPKARIEVALEVPGNNVDPGYLRQIDPLLINVKPKEVVPDFITRFSHRGKWGYFKTALLLRRLEFEVLSIQNEKALSKSEFGWAMNFSTGIFTFNKKGKLKLQTVFGHGYAGYNNDGGVEIAPDEHFKATVPFQYGFVAFYDYSFSPKWSTSFGYSETVFDNSAGQEESAFHRSQYSVAQLNYYVIPGRLQLGLNFQFGKKYNKDGNSADDERMLFNVTYLFSTVK
jgi:hypothetical protein